MLAGSYSRFSDLKKCPRRFWHKNIKKDIPFVPNAAMERGTQLHLALEKFLKGESNELPNELLYGQIEANRLLKFPEVKAELEFTFDENLKLISWFSKNAWIRIKIDAVAADGAMAEAIDWKTGKKKPDSYQLAMYAWCLMQTRPELDLVLTKYIWLDQSDETREAYFRSDMDNVFTCIQDDMKELNKREPKDIEQWEKNKGWLCGYCEVPRSKCENSALEG